MYEISDVGLSLCDFTGEFSSSFFGDGFVFFLLLLEPDRDVELELEVVEVTDDVDRS